MRRHTALITLLVGLALALAACGMPLFNARPEPLPVLSDTRSGPSEPLARGVVQAVLTESQARAIFDTPVPPHLIDSEHVLKKAWPQTTRDGFAEALGSLWTTTASGVLDSAILRGISIAKVGFGGVSVSPIGYNHDSTYAVIYYEVHCGVRCGHGVILLLARRPGCAWTVWDSALLWLA